MKNNYSRWKKGDIKKLFDFVEEKNKLNCTLTDTFAMFASENGRKPNSVRNYYYVELGYLQNNKTEAESLGINLANHQKTNPDFFTKEEAEKLIESIENLKKKGFSVRKACLRLANGNISKMVRMQNKYRTMIKENCNNQQTMQFPKNIITMPRKKLGLSENEINSLFMGLVKLIKNSAKQEANLKLQKETDNANLTLRKTLMELGSKEKQVAKLKENMALLKAVNQKLDTQIKNLRSTNPKIENDGKKMKAFKSYSDLNSKHKHQKKNGYL